MNPSARLDSLIRKPVVTVEAETERAPINATGELGTHARAKGCAHQPIM